MPRFFFHVIDGFSLRDRDGTELPDLYTAQAEAVTLAGEILRDVRRKLWDGTDWKMEVADERGQTLFVLRFSAEETLVGRSVKP